MNVAKNVPKRLGEIVDQICVEAGIRERIVPRSSALHKSEATAILQFIQILREREDRRIIDLKELADLAGRKA